MNSRLGVTATVDMAVLPGVLGCRTLRRTVQVRLVSNTLWLPGTRRKRLRCAWHDHLHGLATAIHKTSGLGSHQGGKRTCRLFNILNLGRLFWSKYSF